VHEGEWRGLNPLQWLIKSSTPLGRCNSFGIRN
jgi:hypothetical protein